MPREADRSGLVLATYERLSAGGVVPSQREVARATGLTHAGVNHCLLKLEREGRVRRAPSRARSVVVTPAPSLAAQERRRQEAFEDLDAGDPSEGLARFEELVALTLREDPVGALRALLAGVQTAELTVAQLQGLGPELQTVLLHLALAADHAGAKERAR